MRIILTFRPADLALSTPATVERELITTATSAFSSPRLMQSTRFIRVVPPPLIRTPRRIGFELLFFSADIGFPRELAKQGQAGSEVKAYAVGRIVLWSADMDATKMTLASLVDPKITKIAIANPKHAPYGKRAEEALRSAGVWEKVQGKLVYGENIAQTAQYVQSGNAQVGIIALALVLNPELSKKGGYYLVPGSMHNPLEQGFIITKLGAPKPLAKQFAEYMGSKQVRSIMTKYGFVLPGEKAGK